MEMLLATGCWHPVSPDDASSLLMNACAYPAAVCQAIRNAVFAAFWVIHPRPPDDPALRLRQVITSGSVSA
jgi:hypothetical protein